MDRDKFFEEAGFRSTVFKHGKVKMTLVELNLSQRRAVIEATESKAPMEAVAALTVAMSCPDFSEEDIETLVEKVRPDVLVAAGQRVFEISSMIEEAKGDAKKPCAPQKSGNFFSRWRWPWGAQSPN